MLFEPKDEDRDRIDYFDSADVPEEPKKEPKRPTYKPDDPHIGTKRNRNGSICDQRGSLTRGYG